ncbi:glycine-rich cell wall structural protein 2-like isoform X2 [Sitophilus oryzae]|uniref:Glycine-rich cell wall structural protein 2-like isoform X2 n=1 Tax=Sitophilus oryzae TaxID=7048 RepID=A0A6J2XGZ4_SITOR|nr:glycine-rich cell wall structural protein 2-like isoform X2 [Sitophilus oryzae]
MKFLVIAAVALCASANAKIILKGPSGIITPQGPIGPDGRGAGAAGGWGGGWGGAGGWEGGAGRWGGDDGRWDGDDGQWRGDGDDGQWRGDGGAGGAKIILKGPSGIITSKGPIGPSGIGAGGAGGWEGAGAWNGGGYDDGQYRGEGGWQGGWEGEGSWGGDDGSYHGEGEGTAAGVIRYDGYQGEVEIIGARAAPANIIPAGSTQAASLRAAITANIPPPGHYHAEVTRYTRVVYPNIGNIRTINGEVQVLIPPFTRKWQ